MKIEELRWWHIAQLLPIEETLFGAERWSAGMFWGELAAGHYYRVATDGEAVLGYAGLATTGPDEATVQNIAVRPEHQRRGIGDALLTDLLAEAYRRGARRILLEVAVGNAAAQSLYERHGFRRIGLRRGYYQPSNTDAVVMERGPAEGGGAAAPDVTREVTR